MKNYHSYTHTSIMLENEKLQMLIFKWHMHGQITNHKSKRICAITLVKSIKLN
jgi:hypothetical protein